MMTDISQKLKSDIKVEDLKQENGILCYMNDYFISGDNQKYMKMYKKNKHLIMKKKKK